MKYGELISVQTTEGQTIQGFPVVIPSNQKTAVLRLPTNDEMLEYLAKQRSVYRDLGRRKGESEPVANPQADLGLFQRVRLDSGPEFDEFEAARAIRNLTRQQVTECVRDGDTFRITLKTAFGPTVHVLGMPSEKDISLYRRSVYRAIELPHGVEERRFPPEVPVRLYDAVVQSIEGYVEGIDPRAVPPHHKSAVIVELVQEYEQLDPPLDPNF